MPISKANNKDYSWYAVVAIIVIIQGTTLGGWYVTYSHAKLNARLSNEMAAQQNNLIVAQTLLIRNQQETVIKLKEVIDLYSEAK